MISLLLSRLEQVFGWLLAASWQASVLALLVLLLQAALRGRLNPRWRSTLWLLVLVRLVLPVEPECALSLFQFAPQSPPAFIEPVTEPLFIEPAIVSTPEVELPMPEPSHPLSVYSFLAMGWLTGAAILLLLTWQVNRRFGRQIANSRGFVIRGY